MATMNISLPDSMKTWVETQTQGGAYSNSSDFIRDLIRRDQERRGKIGMVQALVDEARNTGISAASMADVRRTALERLASDKG